jgi:hypothetical protein
MATVWDRTKLYLGLVPAGEQPLGPDRTWFQRFVTVGDDMSTRSLALGAVLFAVLTASWPMIGRSADTTLERIVFWFAFVVGSALLVWPRLRLLARRWT